jgi:hypothetical protein
MINGLQFCYLWHDYDMNEVRIVVGNGRFCGTTNVYVEIGGLVEAARVLEGFPKDARDSREVEFGNFGPKSAGGAVRLRFQCKDLAGHTEIRAELEDDYLSLGNVESATLFLDFEPAALDEFVVTLRRLEADRESCAELRAIERSW